MSAPLISVIIVNWNGAAWLDQCLQSVITQPYPRLEIIVIDNASSDNSRSLIKNNFPTIRLIASPSNVGFASGCNLGVRHAQGQYLLFLNTDASLGPNFFPPLIKQFEGQPQLAAVSPQIRDANEPQKIDNCGSFWSASTFLYHYGYRQPASKAIYNAPRFFFSLKGAIFFVRRSHLETVGGFDDDFWCYYEETDLCHRFWLAGFTCLYYPSVIGYHHGGRSAAQVPAELIHFHSFKNHLQSFMKNFSWPTLCYVLPTHLVVIIITSIIWAVQGRIRQSVSVYQAIFWTMQHLPHILRKRQTVQKLRQVPDRAYLGPLKKNPPLTYFVHTFLPGVAYVEK